MNQACIVCKGTSLKPLYKGILQCQTCHYVFADLSLTDDDFAELYNQHFFREGEWIDYAADRKFISKNFRLRRRVLRRFLQPARHQHLLEIGSAYGFFLDLVRADFQTIEGIDLTEEGVRHTQEQLGLAAVHGDFLKHDFGNRQFDVVCMWDTIEHLRRPDLYLQKISDCTEPGALLTITTGDIASLNARLRGEQWRMIHPPTHAHYFSSETLARLLNAHGFDVIYNRYCGFFRSARNVAYNVLVLRHGKREMFDWLQKAGLLNWGFYLNLYDIMYVIARKR